MSAGNLILLAILCGLAGAVGKAIFIHNRRYPTTLAALIGAVAGVLVAFVLLAAGVDGSGPVVATLAASGAAAALAGLFMPRPAITVFSVQSSSDGGPAPEHDNSARDDEQASLTRENEDAGPEFDVDGVVFYDGSGHQLGPSRVSLVAGRIVIAAARGGMNQILVRDIQGVNVPAPVISPTMLRVKLSATTFDLYCNSKLQRSALEQAAVQQQIREGR